MQLVRAWVALSLFAGGCTLYLDEDPVPPVEPPDPPPQAISRTLFMSFDGVALSPGAVDDATQDISTVVEQAVTLAPYLDGDPQRDLKIAAIVDEMRAILAPFDVRVTSQRPAAGTYHMIVTTDLEGADIGLTDVRSILPLHCNTVPSGVALHIAAGVELNQHVLAQHSIAMFGLFNGIPSSNLANDCMCFDGLECLSGHGAGPCVVSGPNTPIAEVTSCAGGGGTMDVRERFFEQYGAAP